MLEPQLIKINPSKFFFMLNNIIFASLKVKKFNPSQCFQKKLKDSTTTIFSSTAASRKIFFNQQNY